MGHDEDTVLLLCEFTERQTQCLHFLWSEEGRGLIQDQDTSTPHEGLENFHALLLAHREFADRSLEVDLDAITLRQSCDLGLNGTFVGHDAAEPTVSKDEVLQHRQARD